MIFNIQKCLNSITKNVKIKHLQGKNARKRILGGNPDLPPVHGCTAESPLITWQTVFPQNITSFCVKKDLLALVLSNDWIESYQRGAVKMN